MTRFPTESRDVQGLSIEEWPVELPKVGPRCAVPGCTRAADHAHHLFSRGIMGGAFNWVRLPDGNVSGNLMGICASHHQLVTENKAVISYEDDGYYWTDAYRPKEKLTQQPPLVLKKEMEELPSNGHHPVEEPGHIVTEQHHREICPTCERPMPKPKLDTDNEAEKPRERKTWAISVPADKWEDGADVLDVLLEAARDEMDKVGLSYGEGKKIKFAILSTALALFVNHAEQILADA